jgi:hypothetical protein
MAPFLLARSRTRPKTRPKPLSIQTTAAWLSQKRAVLWPIRQNGQIGYRHFRPAWLSHFSAWLSQNYGNGGDTIEGKNGRFQRPLGTKKARICRLRRQQNGGPAEAEPPQQPTTKVRTHPTEGLTSLSGPYRTSENGSPQFNASCR